MIDRVNDERRYANVLKLIETDNKLSKRNKKIIIKFLTWNNSCGLKQKIKYAYQLRLWLQLFSRDYDKVTKDMILKNVSDLHEGKIHKPNSDKGYSKDAIRTSLKTLKRFYGSYLKKTNLIKDVKVSNTQNELTKQELWTEKEIDRLIDSANSIQKKAYLSLLTETGCRPCELAFLKIKDIIPHEFNDKELMFTVKDSKTKWSNRNVDIIDSVALIRNWLMSHPLKDDSNAPLWIRKEGREWIQRSQSNLANMVKQCIDKTGIKKPSYPYIFRHTAITRDKIKRMSDDLIKKKHGHSPTSNVTARYTHLDSRDLYNEQKRIRNQSGSKEKKDFTIICPCCKNGFRNLDTKQKPYCITCGYTLNEETRMKEELAKRKTIDNLGMELKEVISMLNSRLENLENNRGV